ncbi:MAG: helicase-related protein [Candidatus Methanoperedens sp.]|nr:helicase-related protein [Candidatus Methanoperedens sp.]
MTTDLTFITNEEKNKLVDRFAALIKDSQYFDCLVGYFYTSGFNSLYGSLENTEKIRILIGISTNKETYDLIQESQHSVQMELQLSHKETKEDFSNKVVKELEDSEDTIEVADGASKFIEWITSGKLEIRVYPAEKIHSKLYIMTFKEGDRDTGRVITGSSNFTESGLRNNLEFNVELKNSSDHKFALDQFNKLWENSVDVSDEYVETIKTKTWLNDEITPYELYLKFLYEYLEERINLDLEDVEDFYRPPNFMDLEYQRDAVQDAKLKLEEFGGVFISDVVGLGKTFIATMLAQQLDGRTLVIAPPVLIDRDNPGSWTNVFEDFGIRQAYVESRGKLDDIIRRGTDKYKNIIIDEAHSFRNESTQSYEKLAQICRGKRVVLVSATPLNNTPLDILSQIKLFQDAHKSTLRAPKVKDLERYFNGLQSKLKGLDRQQDKEEYLSVVRKNAEDIRKNVLKDLMVRRTRSVILENYGEDLKKQNLTFPEVGDPEPIYYNFDKELDGIFTDTVDIIVNQFKYARYTPLLYLEKSLTNIEEISQRNMQAFMRVLLLKRLESSIFAFNKSISRFIYSYEKFIEQYQKGNVYVSKKHINKIFEYLDNDDDESIQKLIDEDKATAYASDDFYDNFIVDLNDDLEALKKIQGLWAKVKNDPKLEKFIERLKTDPVLANNKLIVFTESKETAHHLEEMLNPVFGNKVRAFSSFSSPAERTEIIDNFDANARNQKDDIRIVISTEILAEGVNLHRSCVVINYDIPWNPTRMMQRVGRINRVDSKFDKIYTYNFFPAGQINENISLQEAAEAKIEAFIEMLGNDARLLTDEEIKSHDLYKRLTSRESIIGEDEDDPELRHLTFLRELRDTDKELFNKIKKLPKKARSAKKYIEDYTSTVTFLRKGKVRKIFKTTGNVSGICSEEIDFERAAEIFEAGIDTKREKIEPGFYKHLDLNKKEFADVFIRESESIKPAGNRGNKARLIQIIRAIEDSPEFTGIENDYLRDVFTLLRDGSLPKATIKKIIDETRNEIAPFKIYGKIKSGIPEQFFQSAFVTSSADTRGKREVILSEYLHKGE